MAQLTWVVCEGVDIWFDRKREEENSVPREEEKERKNNQPRRKVRRRVIIKLKGRLYADEAVAPK